MVQETRKFGKEVYFLTKHQRKKRWMMWMEFRGKAIVQRNSNLFKPTQAINRKHCFLLLNREKSKGM